MLARNKTEPIMVLFSSISSSIHHSLVPQVALANWLPLCRVDQVPTTHVKTLDIEYVKIGVFKSRGEGLKAIHPTCPHRHGPLCGESIANDGTIVCPYHGAKFSTRSGKCLDFLGSSDMLQSSLHEYETRVDQDDVLWCKVNDDPLPFPELPCAVKKDERVVRGTTDVDVSAFDLVENLCCCTHVHQVHKFGNKKDPQPKNMNKCVVSQQSCGYTYDYNSGGSSTVLSSGVVNVANGFYGPFSLYSNVAFEDYRKQKRMKSIRVSVLPLSPTRSRMFWAIGRDFMTHGVFDPVARYIMETTIAEDAALLRRMTGPRPTTTQVLTKFDWIIAKYRQHLLECND